MEMSKVFRVVMALVMVGLAANLSAAASDAPPDTYRFAVIGDFGSGTINEARVAALVAGWGPDFVITTGDNNYSSGGVKSFDRNVGRYYSAFIGDYQGDYGPGSETNRFWPSLGNHDWRTISCGKNGCNGAYLEFFTLPGNELYYMVDYGIVSLFAADSKRMTAEQQAWLTEMLAESEACWNVVYFHHPPFSSGKHGSTTRMRLPFAEWGADVVMSGHEHSYERIEVDGRPYFVNGAGGKSLYPFRNVGRLPAEATSEARYNSDYGAMLVMVTPTRFESRFFNTAGVLIDEFAVDGGCEE